MARNYWTTLQDIETLSRRYRRNGGFSKECYLEMVENALLKFIHNSKRRFSQTEYTRFSEDWESFKETFKDVTKRAINIDYKIETVDGVETLIITTQFCNARPARKTMRRDVLQKRFDSLKKSGDLAINGNIKEAIDDILNGGKKIRTGYYTGSGRWTRAVDFTDDLKYILRAAGIVYRCGNDAPRGGVSGKFIEIKTKIV